MNPANLVAFVASLAVGTGVLFANTKRNLNRAFFLLTLNVAAWPTVTAWLTGCVVIAGAALTVSVAALLVTLPKLFVTVTVNCEPLSVLAVAGVV